MHNSKFKVAAITLSTALLLAACKGGGSGSDGSFVSQDTLSDDEIRALVRETNYHPDYVAFDKQKCQDTECAQEGVIRFSKESLIPVYFISADGSEPDSDIVGAIQRIEDKLGSVFEPIQVKTADLTQFRDSSRPDENIGNGTWNQKKDEFLDSLQISYGLVISNDTGFYNKNYNISGMCANFSSGPYEGGTTIKVDMSTHTYSSDYVGFVNLGSPNCDSNLDIATHEIAHSMGMFTHFEPHFGSWSDTAMRVLHTIYDNAPRTGYDVLSVSQ